ncbi:hypothetical protein D7D25_12785 [Proteiniphilum sp. X52]|nr:hypothetical protein D7D25_12785 [Proteiniphilum sp. X52]
MINSHPDRLQLGQFYVVLQRIKENKSDSRLWILDSRLRIAGSKLRIADFKFRLKIQHVPLASPDMVSMQNIGFHPINSLVIGNW